MSKAEPTYINLTDEQHEKLQPLFDKANIAYAQHGPKGNGAIFAQIRETDEVTVRFVSAEIANRIATILRETEQQKVDITKCPHCGADLQYYHSGSITRAVCKKKCQGWKILQEIDREKMDAKKLKDLILQKEAEGMVVFMTSEGPMEADLEDFIKQPTEGLLYDLNRDRGTVLSFLDDPNMKWINDLAVGMVIAKLKKYYDSHQK